MGILRHADLRTLARGDVQPNKLTGKEAKRSMRHTGRHGEAWQKDERVTINEDPMFAVFNREPHFVLGKSAVIKWVWEGKSGAGRGEEPAAMLRR